MKKIIALLLVGFTLVSCSGKNDTAKNVENGAQERIAELEKENKELKEKLSQYQKELISNESGQKIEKYLESFNNTIKVLTIVFFKIFYFIFINKINVHYLLTLISFTFPVSIIT